MDKYISKHEVIDYLNGYLHSLGYDNTELLVNGQRKALINAIQDISAVKAADVQPANQWISVKDRLPEERKCVLVYDGGICIAWRYKGEWESDDYTLATVAYWQPLPDPPVNP